MAKTKTAKPKAKAKAKTKAKVKNVKPTTLIEDGLIRNGTMVEGPDGLYGVIEQIGAEQAIVRTREQGELVVVTDLASLRPTNRSSR